MSNEPLICQSLIGSCSVAIALFIAGCDALPGAGAEAAGTNAHNMRLVGYHDLQARSAYQPVVHAYGERRILFVGQHAGEAMNPDTGVIEVNGMSILDVTDPSAPVLLRHVPPTGDQASGTQHVQVCDGSMLPNGDPDRIYLVRTNGLLSYEMFDVTDPAEPQFLRTIATTGVSARGESSRGNRETHKIQWDCESGIGYFNGTPQGWRVTRVLQAFDLSDPEQPRHIRDFGLVGWQPGAEGPLPANSVSGLHQPFVVGNRMYLGYGSGNDGTLQILDRDKFLNGDPEADDPFAPTPENLLYPQIARLDMPAYWGVHTAKPIYGIEIPDYDDDAENRVRDFLLIPSEAGGGAYRCQGTRDVMFIVDITQEDKPFPVSTYQVSEESGNFCNRGGRFGPHSINDTYHPGFDKSLVVLSYFNAGIRAVDIRNPFKPVEVGHFIPEVTENTIESCVEINGTEICDVVIQTNNVDIDDRGYIYAVDRSSTGLHIVELTGEAREIVGLD
ncbi:MAG: hypothetical protein E2O55_04605 [Gammaproteobacteria bacterium]|nr:MAG: hypothetical protein E2O55_04605 [Gammaproteobacteria bacterium]